MAGHMAQNECSNSPAVDFQIQEAPASLFLVGSRKSWPCIDWTELDTHTSREPHGLPSHTHTLMSSFPSAACHYHGLLGVSGLPMCPGNSGCHRRSRRCWLISQGPAGATRRSVLLALAAASSSRCGLVPRLCSAGMPSAPGRHTQLPAFPSVLTCSPYPAPQGSSCAHLPVVTVRKWGLAERGSL